MTDLAIRVENLSKMYRIGARQKQATTLRERIQNLALSPFDYLHRTLRGPTEEEILWALKDVSFEVNHGEVVGVIGRNGAGKSTLLKILSRITEPTEGRAELYGRVSSLLEVGTGFHHELTGRENIYLNGTILGMTKTEVDRKFDEIVSFSGVEKFIDTPVKRYSSGMRVRLAFSVAAHLEPEILLIDEVLAVGDASFQKKCLGKMGEVARRGRTVLFVSHQLGMVRNLCERTILLEDGSIIADGSSSLVVDRYVLSFGKSSEEHAEIRYPEDLAKKAQILNVSVQNKDGRPSTSYDVFDIISFQACIAIRETITGMSINLIVRRNGAVLFRTYDIDAHPELLNERKPGLYNVSVDLPSPLKAGHYTLTPILGILNVGGIDKRENALIFTIEENSFNTSMFSYSSKRSGVMATHLEWSNEESESEF